MLTVGELKEMLKNVPDDLVIVKSTDDEGNGYIFADSIETDVFYRGDYYLELFDGDQLSDDDIEEMDLTKCIVLW